MATATDTLDLAHRQLRLYEERTASKVEGWKRDHDEARRCFRFEEHIAFGISIFNHINRVDEAWHTRVFKKQLPYDEELDGAIRQLYAAWAKRCPVLLRALERFETRRFDVAGAEEFRSCCREVKGILATDAKFFAGEAGHALAKLRDAATEAHSRGETAEMVEIDD